MLFRGIIMNTKITQIRVDGYKNLFDCVVDLNDFNVLVGPNNSGKTNLIEAVLMLGLIVSAGEDGSKTVLSSLRIVSSSCFSVPCLSSIMQSMT